jgi:choline dehydrogenase
VKRTKQKRIYNFFLKVLVENKKAVGVSFVRDNMKYSIMANKEVILSAGTIGSPQILMLSGIGPKDHLKSKGVWLFTLLYTMTSLQCCRELE